MRGGMETVAMATEQSDNKQHVGDGMHIYILGWLLFLWFDFGGGPIGVVAGPCLLSITSSLHHRNM